MTSSQKPESNGPDNSGSHPEHDETGVEQDEGSGDTQSYREGVFGQGHEHPDHEHGQGVFEQGHAEPADQHGQGVFEQGHAEPADRHGQGVYEQGRPDEDDVTDPPAH